MNLDRCDKCDNGKIIGCGYIEHDCPDCHGTALSKWSRGKNWLTKKYNSNWFLIWMIASFIVIFLGIILISFKQGL
jgi:hypothetical protein